MEPNTHLQIAREWVGTPDVLSPGKATVTLHTRPAMGADAQGLVHGGFVFGLADYAAMLAVNDPNVVLGAADCRFLAPVKVGDAVVAEAERTAHDGRKHTVSVTCRVGETEVFQGTFQTFVLDRHVLASRA